MNTAIRCLKALLVLSALTGAGLVLRWVTAGSVGSASTHDLQSMAFLAIGAVAWVAYGWLVLATLATVLEQIPGAIGHTASALAAGITSRGSRALLRSALGVAAVTPLTIGLAHASPTHPESIGTTTTSTPNAVPTTPATSAALQPAPGGHLARRSHPQTHLVGEPSASNWRSIERPSTIHLTNPRADRAAVQGGSASGIGTGTGVSRVPAPQFGGIGTGSAGPRTTHAGSGHLRSRQTDAKHAGSAQAGSAQAGSAQAGSAQAADARAGFAQVDSGRVGAGLVGPPSAGSARGREGQGGVGRGRADRVVVPDRPMGGGGERYVEVPGEGRRPEGRVVRVGESLWGIAKEELGGRASDGVVEARMRQWYAVNRQVIGPDPNLIRPGQVLRTPGRQRTPISQEN